MEAQNCHSRTGYCQFIEDQVNDGYPGNSSHQSPFLIAITDKARRHSRSRFEPEGARFAQDLAYQRETYLISGSVARAGESTVNDFVEIRTYFNPGSGLSSPYVNGSTE